MFYDVVRKLGVLIKKISNVLAIVSDVLIKKIDALIKKILMCLFKIFLEAGQNFSRVDQKSYVLTTRYSYVLINIL